MSRKYPRIKDTTREEGRRPEKGDGRRKREKGKKWQINGAIYLKD